MNFDLQLGSTSPFERQMATIPANVNTLNLRMNLLSPAELIAALRCIPARIISLSLASNNLQRFSSAELAQIMAAIPAHITQLDLSNNNLSNVLGLGQTLRATPATIDTLTLSNNSLYELENIDQEIGAVPATVTTFLLRQNSLQIANFDALIALFRDVKASRLSLRHNLFGLLFNGRELAQLFAALSRSVTELQKEGRGQMPTSNRFNLISLTT